MRLSVVWCVVCVVCGVCGVPVVLLCCGGHHARHPPPPSSHAHMVQGEAEHTAAEALLAARNPNADKNSPEGLEGLARRCVCVRGL